LEDQGGVHEPKCHSIHLVHAVCDESHFYLYFSSFFPYIFNTITTKRWQVANKETLLQHSQALWPSRLTWHYQDYDVNYDDRAADSCSHSICFPIQCSLLWLALLSLLSFYQHSSISRLSLSGFSSFLHCAICLLYSLVLTQRVMCALFSTIALASLHNSCGSYLTIVILLRRLLRHAALPLAYFTSCSASS